MSKPIRNKRSILKELFRRTRSGGEEFVVPEGYTPMGEFAEDDIFIVGYPKSGNTWFQDLVAAVAYGMLPEYCPPKVVHELIPDVHVKTFYRRYGTPMYFKTHHLPRPEYRRVVYLLRDGRDVMVSYFHHFLATQKNPVGFLQFVQGGEALFPCKWPEHVKAWLTNPFGAEFILMRYEHLKKDTARELARFCEFANLKREPALIQQIAEATRFEKMRDKEARMGLAGFRPWSENKMFRRRGQVGSYKDEMPPEVLETFEAEARETLQQLGYE
jgi:hypothetical protein